jgi:hypothetical protein
VLLSNWEKQLVSADRDLSHKLWGMFVGNVFYLTMNWLDRMTYGGRAGKENSKIGIDLERGHPLTTETMQMNLMDGNLFVCVCCSLCVCMCDFVLFVGFSLFNSNGYNGCGRYGTVPRGDGFVSNAVSFAR